MQWLPVLAVGLLLTACGGSGDSSSSSNSSSSAASSGAATKGVSTDADASADTTDKTEANEADAKVAPVSETGDEVTDTDTGSSLESLKLATLPSTVNVPGFKEGVHYRRLVPVQPTGAAIGTVRVAEIFSYGCAPCFELDNKVEAWRAKHKPAYVVFERIPATADNTQHFYAQTFYAMEQLGKLDTLHPLVFREIQAGAALSDVTQLGKFLIAQQGADLNQRAIAAAFKSKEVAVQMQRASDLQRRYRVDSLPYFVIGGKFVTTSAMAGDDDRLMTLLTQLSIREHEF